MNCIIDQPVHLALAVWGATLDRCLSAASPLAFRHPSRDSFEGQERTGNQYYRGPELVVAYHILYRNVGLVLLDSNSVGRIDSPVYLPGEHQSSLSESRSN